VQEVLIAAVDVLFALAHGNAVGGGVGESVLARTDVPDAPGRDHFEMGRERLVGELEANLVVAFSGAAMGKSGRSLVESDLHLALRDERPGERGPEEILSLVLRSRAESGEHVVTDEFRAQVFDVGLRRADGAGLRRSLLQVLRLTHVGEDRDDLAVVVCFQPGDRARGVQSSRVREDDSFRAHRFRDSFRRSA
jgi:hypothetical protein